MTEFSETQKEFIKDLFLKLNNTINEKTDEIRQELRAQICKIKEETEEKVEQLQQKIQELEVKNEELQRNIFQFERNLRKKNVIIYGIEREEKNLFEHITGLFRNILELEINEADLSNVYRIPTKRSEKCPVVVEFLTVQKKILVLNNAKKLKGKNIFIARDLCKKDRQQNKILIEHQKQARVKGKQAYIKKGKLYIDGREFGVEQLEEGEQSSRTENKDQLEEVEDNRVRRREERDKKKTKPGINKEQKATDFRIQTRSVVDSKK